MTATTDLPVTIQAKIAIVGDCWEWTGARNSKGYASVTNGAGGSMLAHRKTYALIKGEIPTGYEVDHLCDNPPCVNPDHLEAVTPEEHRRRIGHEDLKPLYREPLPAPEPIPELLDFIAKLQATMSHINSLGVDERAEYDARLHRLHVATGTRCTCRESSDFSDDDTELLAVAS